MMFLSTRKEFSLIVVEAPRVTASFSARCTVDAVKILKIPLKICSLNLIIEMAYRSADQSHHTVILGRV